jgi:predicted Zn-dependent protease
MVGAMPLLLTALVACGSSSSPSPSAEVKQTCQRVEAVLSDGPDPTADPVGYAEAQILPLRQIHTSDSKLRQAIDTLASAYQAYSSTDGANAAAKDATDAAIGTLNAACPGAGATL